MGGNTGRQDGPGTNANAGYQQAESWKFPIKNELDYKGRITFRAYKEVTESLGELVGTVSRSSRSCGRHRNRKTRWSWYSEPKDFFFWIK